VRAAESAVLLRDASAAEVLQGVQAVSAGEAYVPARLRGSVPVLRVGIGRDSCVSGRRRLGLSRRELQIIPLIAQASLTRKSPIIFAFPRRSDP